VLSCVLDGDFGPKSLALPASLETEAFDFLDDLDRRLLKSGILPDLPKSKL
jgi:hypothetical protein